MAADEETWRNIKAAYVSTKETMSAISARFGDSSRRIQAKAKKEDWPRRRKQRNSRKSTNAKQDAEDTDLMRDAVVRQLYRRMSQRLTKMERMSAEGTKPAADDPDDRMLTSLIKQFEKLTGLHGTAERERKPGREPAAATRARANRTSGAPETQATTLDAERLREEIVGRLERLHAERRGKSASK